MEIGNKILELRKKNNLSQEKLAEQVGVARQTISKWELGETSPDLKQSKKLSEIFNISLDELVNISKNETNNEVVNDTNSQKLAGIILKILKGIGIFLLVFIIVYLIIIILSFVAFNGLKTNKSVEIIEESEEIIIEE
ncbi:MAG: helix-turn-helix transcriptional regulator [Clostridia bacterium]|nr:helix-turn-helix transcriptional regulator [Clostridia bacterium]MBP3596544.1 helix-turn-helix transcriptional regulator [Clostridia bacterium]